MRARYFAFADDTVLVYSGTDEQSLNEEINIDLKKYSQWLFFNKLKINIDKTKYLLFKQKNKIVREMTIQMNDLVLESRECEVLGLDGGRQIKLEGTCH